MIKNTHKYSLTTPHPPTLWESKKKKEKARTVELVKLEFKSKQTNCHSENKGSFRDK